MRLAFIDLETTGLCPRTDRITEIGVVAVNGNRKKEWTTLLNPGSRISARSRLFNGIDDALVSSAPRFAEIAGELSKLLADRLIIAHNARFDYSFLRAEFERVGVDFSPRVLCSVMLSRKLYPDYYCTDLSVLA